MFQDRDPHTWNIVPEFPAWKLYYTIQAGNPSTRRNLEYALVLGSLRKGKKVGVSESRREKGMLTLYETVPSRTKEVRAFCCDTVPCPLKHLDNDWLGTRWGSQDESRREKECG